LLNPARLAMQKFGDNVPLQSSGSSVPRWPYPRHLAGATDIVLSPL